MASNTMLVVDTSIPALLEQKRELDKVGIQVFRVDSMFEAVSRLLRGEEYLCVVINEDSIPDFMVLLPVMSDVAKTQLFVTTHSYTKSKHTMALNLGADAYVAFGLTAREDALCAIEHLKLPVKWAQRPFMNIPALAGGDIILSKSRRCVFVKDTEINLTGKEFDILLLLMDKQGKVMTYDQIMDCAWDSGSNALSRNAIGNHVKRLRRKIAAVSLKSASMIKSIPGSGYQFMG